MKLELDEDSLNENAEETYNILMKTHESMKNMMGFIDDQNAIRTMIISAYVLGAKAAMDRVNESLNPKK